MLLGSLCEILTIACIMIFVLRSLKFVLLFLIPNLLPPFIAFGIWGVTKGQFGLALSVVVAMTLGIIVDDTIHFFIKYFRARKEEGLTPEQAVRAAFETVGSAIGITTTVLIAGFLVMTRVPLPDELGDGPDVRHGDRPGAAGGLFPFADFVDEIRPPGG